MANIKLNNLAKQFGDKTPTGISDLSNFQNKIKTEYADLKLDITNINTGGIFTDNNINSDIAFIDIELSKNEAAIINSVKNWFKTTRYSRLLNPGLHMALDKYLFEGVNEYNAYFLAMEILGTLPIYEPRINIELCEVIADYNNDAFEIALTISIPSLNNKLINLTEILSSIDYTNL